MKLRILNLVVISLLCVLLGSSLVNAEDITGREIIDHINTMNLISDMKAELKLEIIHKTGQKRIRKLQMVSRKDKDGIEKTLVRFLSPTDIRGTGFLSSSNPEGIDEKYLYLPAMGRPRRLSSDERGDSFMGSDFTYEDLSPSIEDYNYSLLRTVEIEGHKVYVVESVPRTKKIGKEVGYYRKLTWVRKEHYSVLKAEYRDKSGYILKKFEVMKTEKIADNLWMPVELQISNLEKGSRSVLKYEKIEINTGLKDSDFTIRQLTRPL